MSWLAEFLARLEQQETAELARAAKLREQVTALQEQLAASEEQLARLSISRETALALDHADDGTDRVAPRGGTPTSSEDQTASEEDPGSDRDQATMRQRPRLSDVDEQVVAMLASRGRAMRARETALAMGESDVRGRVEVMRSRLKRLTNSGWLIEEDRGLFTVAEGLHTTGGVNGYAATGGAATHH